MDLTGKTELLQMEEKENPWGQGEIRRVKILRDKAI